MHDSRIFILPSIALKLLLPLLADYIQVAVIICLQARAGEHLWSLVGFHGLTHSKQRTRPDRRGCKRTAQVIEHAIKHQRRKSDGERQPQAEANNAAHVNIGFLVQHIGVFQRTGGMLMSSVHGAYPPPSTADRKPGTAGAISIASRRPQSKDRPRQQDRPNPSTKSCHANL